MLDSGGYAALSRIYDAATRAALWRPALDSIANAVDAAGVALLVRQPQDENQRDAHHFSSVLDAFARSPWGYYHELRLGHLQRADWDRLREQPAHRPTPDTAFGASTEALDARPDYRLLRKRLNIGRRIGVRLNADTVWFEAISIALGRNEAGLPDPALRRLFNLLPHITKSLEQSRLFEALLARHGSVLTALDHVGTGLAVARLSGEIIVANTEARRILSLNDGLTRLAEGHFRTASPAQTASLHAAIVEACKTADGQANYAEEVTKINRPSGAAPLLIEIAPLRDSGRELGGSANAALLTLIDTDHMPYARMERFAALHGLTTDDLALIDRVFRGSALVTEMSARSSAGYQSPEQRSDALLKKLGVENRADLIRWVLRVLPPVS